MSMSAEDRLIPFAQSCPRNSPERCAIEAVIGSTSHASAMKFSAPSEIFLRDLIQSLHERIRTRATAGLWQLIVLLTKELASFLKAVGDRQLFGGSRFRSTRLHGAPLRINEIRIVTGSQPLEAARTVAGGASVSERPPVSVRNGFSDPGRGRGSFRARPDQDSATPSGVGYGLHQIPVVARSRSHHRLPSEPPPAAC